MYVGGIDGVSCQHLQVMAQACNAVFIERRRRMDEKKDGSSCCQLSRWKAPNLQLCVDRKFLVHVTLKKGALGDDEWVDRRS